MTKRILFSAIALLPVLAFAQDTKFTVQGKIGSLNAPAKAYIQYRNAGKTIADSVELKNGEFTFTGTAAVNAGPGLFNFKYQGHRHAGPAIINLFI
jgi:hypothetical protein